MVCEGRHDRLFVGGGWVPATGHRLEVVSPFTEEVIADVPSAAPRDIDRAVHAAREAFDHGPWPRLQIEERMAALRELRRLIADNQESIARLVTDEMGCPITQSRAIQAVNPVRVIDAYLDLVPDYPFRSVRTSDTGSALVTREPVGVVAAAVPRNVPVGSRRCAVMACDASPSNSVASRLPSSSMTPTWNRLLRRCVSGRSATTVRCAA